MNPGAFPKFHLFLICALSLLMTVAAVVGPTDRKIRAADPDRSVGPVESSMSVTPAVAGTSELLAPTPDTGSAAPLRVTSASLASIVPLPMSGPSLVEAVEDAVERAVDDAVVVPMRVTATPPANVKRVKVRKGDSLSAIFKREGFSSTDLHRLVTGDPLGKRLKNIFPGQELTFTLGEDGSLAKLTYSPTSLQTLEFERNDKGFQGRERNVEPERTKAYKHGVIDQSLFLASQGVGLSDALTMRLAQIFQWDVDFVLDIRRGDEFHVVYEELYVGDEFVGFGDILAAEFINQGRSHRAIHYTDAAGRTGYYGPNGEPMRQAFIRAPVEFTRISSNFNLRRVHPLFNRAAPHRGIDYAAPTGTPVMASGDGRVVTASRTEPNGNYIVIAHGEKFVTKYLHLSRFARGIKSGVRVKQGQIIGYVGATGWATGPHLHYEFLVNGVHQNPRTVKLPNADPIPAGELPQFNQRAKPLLALLEDYKQQVQLALGP